MNICKCGGKLSAAIGWPSERRYVCYKCGATVRVESYCEDAPDPAEPPPTEQRPPVPPPSREDAGGQISI